MSKYEPLWKYINIRRLFIFLEESIKANTNWVVFEPNDEILWNRIIAQVKAFLYLKWVDGALFGATPEEAFFVKCDEESITLIRQGRIPFEEIKKTWEGY